MKTITCKTDEEKIQSTKEAIRNYFATQKLKLVEENGESEVGWSWSAIAGDSDDTGSLKNHLFVIKISKLSDQLSLVSYGRDICATEIMKTIVKGSDNIPFNPLGPLVSQRLSGGAAEVGLMMKKGRKTEKDVGSLLHLCLEINENQK